MLSKLKYSKHRKNNGPDSQLNMSDLYRGIYTVLIQTTTDSGFQKLVSE